MATEQSRAMAMLPSVRPVTYGPVTNAREMMDGKRSRTGSALNRVLSEDEKNPREDSR